MIFAVIVAAGSGSRMGTAVKKQYLTLNDRPIIAHTLLAFDRYRQLERIILVAPESDLDPCRRQIVAPLRLKHDVQLVAGGRHRQESVRNGLDVWAGSQDDIVMIHDGVRPFLRSSLMDRLIEGAGETGACIPALAATDTLKQVDDRGVIVRTLDREQIRLAQTPQTFTYEVIHNAHLAAAKSGFKATDDASVAEFAGATVTTIPGDPDNIKITTPEDLAIARTIIDRRNVEKAGPI